MINENCVKYVNLHSPRPKPLQLTEFRNNYTHFYFKTEDILTGYSPLTVVSTFDSVRPFEAPLSQRRGLESESVAICILRYNQVV